MKLWFWSTVTRMIHPFYWGAWNRYYKEYGKNKPRKGDFASRMAEAELDE
jgi:hypothetical protein